MYFFIFLLFIYQYIQLTHVFTLFPEKKRQISFHQIFVILVKFQEL